MAVQFPMTSSDGIRRSAPAWWYLASLAHAIGVFQSAFPQLLPGQTRTGIKAKVFLTSLKSCSVNYSSTSDVLRSFAHPAQRHMYCSGRNRWQNFSHWCNLSCHTVDSELPGCARLPSYDGHKTAFNHCHIACVLYALCYLG